MCIKGSLKKEGKVVNSNVLTFFSSLWRSTPDVYSQGGGGGLLRHPQLNRVTPVNFVTRRG